MFGGSFGELAVFFVVALIVLGPARLPGLVRKIGRWVGKARSMAREFQQQLENEINLDELNRMTESQTKQARPTSPAPAPSEFPGAPPAAQSSADTDAHQLAASGYPYGAQEPASEPVSEGGAAIPPQPGDDHYSHAHGPEVTPVSHAPADQAASHQKDSPP